MIQRNKRTSKGVWWDFHVRSRLGKAFPFQPRFDNLVSFTKVLKPTGYLPCAIVEVGDAVP